MEKVIEKIDPLSYPTQLQLFEIEIRHDFVMMVLVQGNFTQLKLNFYIFLVLYLLYICLQLF